MPFEKGHKKVPGSGRKKGSRSPDTIEIKAFVRDLLDKPDYRKSLEDRIIAGEVPNIELYLLNRFVGKPKEEIELTANVPLFTVVGVAPDEGSDGVEEE